MSDNETLDVDQIYADNKFDLYGGQLGQRKAASNLLKMTGVDYSDGDLPVVGEQLRLSPYVEHEPTPLRGQAQAHGEVAAIAATEKDFPEGAKNAPKLTGVGHSSETRPPFIPRIEKSPAQLSRESWEFGKVDLAPNDHLK